MTDLERTKVELEKEYNDITAKLSSLSSDINTINDNQIESRLTTAGGFSFIAWAGISLGTPAILNNIAIPDSAIQPLFFGIPIIFGIIGESLLAKLKNIKTSLRSFTTAYTQKDLIETKTRCKMAQAKCYSVAEVLQEAYTQVDSKLTLLSQLPENTSDSQDNNMQDIYLLEENIYKLETLLDKKISEIEIYSSQETLREMFKDSREKYAFFNYPATTLLGMCGGLATFGMPTIYLNAHETSLTEARAIQILSAAVVGGAISLGYRIQKRYNYTSVFKKINSELKENSIPPKMDDQSDQEYRRKLEKAIHEASAIKYQLEIEKRKLENISPERPKILAKNYGDHSIQ